MKNIVKETKHDLLVDKKESLGSKGESYISKILQLRGYSLYAVNVREWGFEVDIVVYRFSTESVLEIRAVEVKTRTKRSWTNMLLEDFKIEQKVERYKSAIYKIGQELVLRLKDEGRIQDSSNLYRKYHLDLALVGFAGKCYLHKYIQNVNLLI